MSDKMSLIGQIILIGGETTVGKKNTKKVEFVINTGGKYPDKVKFSLLGDKVAAIENFSENDVVEVFFNIRGREWKGNYYVDLQAWKIDSAENVKSDFAATDGEGASNDNIPF